MLCPTQYGFRPKQLTVHAILDIVLTCFDNVENKKFTTLLLLDLTKAFDTVQHKTLLAKLNHYGFEIRVKANTSNELKYSPNYELAKINDWIVANNKLTLNAAKSSAIIIKPKLHSPPVEMNLSCAAGSIKK